jgi:hypothetical protein
LKKENQMPEKKRWIYEEILLKRWGISQYTMGKILEDGLPCYDKEGNKFYWEDGCERETEKFKMDDVEKYEAEHPHLFEDPAIGLNAKEKRELGQLRSEKEKWETSLDVAVQIGIFCREQNRRMASDEFDTKMRQIDKDIQDATIRRIRKAIPKKYKSKGGRPKKDK